MLQSDERVNVDCPSPFTYIVMLGLIILGGYNCSVGAFGSGRQRIAVGELLAGMTHLGLVWYHTNTPELLHPTNDILVQSQDLTDQLTKLDTRR